MILNKFTSPFSEGFYRAALSTAATFVVSTFTTYLTLGTLGQIPPDRWVVALMTGAISAFAPFAVGTAVARSDQTRADKMESKPADVPIAAGRS